MLMNIPVKGRPQGWQGGINGGDWEFWRATNWLRDICPAWRVARIDCTVLIADVVGDVEASRSFELGLEECLSLEQDGLLGKVLSDSKEQFGEQGSS